MGCGPEVLPAGSVKRLIQAWGVHAWPSSGLLPRFSILQPSALVSRIQRNQGPASARRCVEASRIPSACSQGAVVLARAAAFLRPASCSAAQCPHCCCHGATNALTQPTVPHVFAQGLEVPVTSDDDAERYGVTVAGKQAHGSGSFMGRAVHGSGESVMLTGAFPCSPSPIPSDP